MASYKKSSRAGTFLLLKMNQRMKARRGTHLFGTSAQATLTSDSIKNGVYHQNNRFRCMQETGQYHNNFLFVHLKEIIRSPPLPHKTSFFDARYAMPDRKEIEIIDGLRVFSLPSALIFCSPKFFIQNPTDARTTLSLVRDASDVLDLLLTGGHSTIAGRLAGAFRNIQRDRIADEIIKTMATAGYDIRENDPFNDAPMIHFSSRKQSPYVNRMRMGVKMRESIIAHFPKAPEHRTNTNAYLEQVEETYLTDAYHSLSIEGYRVNPELIQRVRSGTWNPDNSENNKNHTTALAARSYWQAFKVVKKSVHKVLDKMNPGKVFDEEQCIRNVGLNTLCETQRSVAPKSHADRLSYRCLGKR
jgi:hypothetical protein